MISLVVLLGTEPRIDVPLVIVGYTLLYAAAGLTLWSMYLYLRMAWPHLSSAMMDE